MTRDLAPAHGQATRDEADHSTMSSLLRGVFGVMSGESSIAKLSETLASRKIPDLEPLRDQSLLPGATLSFKNAEGGEDLALSVKHNEQSNKLLIRVQVPSGLKDRAEIASNIRSILEGATDRKVSFKDLEREVGKSASSTDSSSIDYKGEFNLPEGSENVLLAKAQQVFDREEEAEINVGKFKKWLFGRSDSKPAAGVTP